MTALQYCYIHNNNILELSTPALSHTITGWKHDLTWLA